MDLRPFGGWRYSVSNFDDLIAPPYDVLSAADKQSLLERSKNNIVAIDMPHVPPVGEGPLEVYAAAAQTLKQLQAQGVLKQDPKPAVYAYAQEFQWQGKTFCRRAILAGVRATKFGEDVIPHEHTFAGPKADRLQLTIHTRMQLSPIFGFFKGAQTALAELWSSLQSRPADQQGLLRGVRERLWVVDDEQMIGKIASALRDKKVYIADGHHRYTTAMNYRDSLLEQGAIDANHESNYVLFALVERDDPGMLILPTHRVLHGLSASFSVDSLAACAKCFEWTHLPAGSFDFSDAAAVLARYGKHAMAVVAGGGKDIRIAKFIKPELMKQAQPQQTEAWRELDVAILQHMLLEGPMDKWKSAEYKVEYTPDAQIVQTLCAGGAVGFIIQGTPIESVEAVANAGGAMPHKSTYFYPKLSTGVVLKSLQ